MSVATGSSEAAGGAGGGGARVFFQSPRGGAGGSPGSSSGSGCSREDSAPVATTAAAGQVQQQQQQQQQRRHQQGKVTVKYDRKELRKRLVLEEWIVEQLGQLYGCEVLGRGAGRVGAPQLRGASGPDSRKEPSARSEARRLLSPRPPPVPSGVGLCGWDAPTWVQLPVPEELRVLLVAMGRGSSCSLAKRGSEGLTPAAPQQRLGKQQSKRTALTAEIRGAPIFVESEQGRDLKLPRGKDRFWISQRRPWFLKFTVKILRWNAFPFPASPDGVSIIQPCIIRAAHVPKTTWQPLASLV
ncbi:Protein phosphatase 1 regulatory subunit 14C [Plecturocebus cupreus]